MTSLRRVLTLCAIAAIALLSTSLATAAPQRASRAMGCSPGVQAHTTAATGITSTTATLHGKYDFSPSLTSSFYDYGLTTSYGTSVTAASPANGGSGTGTGVDDPKLITGLTPNTTYHFQYRFGSGGTACVGNDLTFTTLAASTITPPAGSESADLALSGPSAPLDVTVGSNATITYIAKHNVGAQALSVGVSSTLPVGLSLVSVKTTSGSCSGSFSCDLGTMNAGDQAAITVVVTANVVGQIILDASIGARNPDPTTGNNRPRVIINVKAPLSTRTINLTSSARIEGNTLAGSKVRLVGTIASDEPRCGANAKISVFQSTTLGGASDITAGALSFTTDANGKFDATFDERAGQFYTLSIAPDEQAAYRCTDATAYFQLAPRLVKRTITGTATRDPLAPTSVRIVGTLSAATPLCAAGQPVVISDGGLARSVTVTTDAKGGFTADVKAPLDFTSPPPYFVNAALTTVQANSCLGIGGNIAAAASPVERSITVAPIQRTPAGFPDTGFTVTGTVTSKSVDCVKGAIVSVVRYPKDGDPVDTGISAKSDAKGKVALSVPDDIGRGFSLVMDKATVASSLCSNANVGFQVPPRTMLRAMTATAVRDPLDVSRASITGSLTGVGRPRVENPRCVPDTISIESRKTGSSGDWKNIAYVRTTTDTGLFAGSFEAAGGGVDYRAVAVEDSDASFICKEAVAAFSLPPQPVRVDISFNVNVVAHGSTGSDFATNGALVQIDGVLKSTAGSCITNRLISIDGFSPNDPNGVYTEGLEPFQGGVLVNASARFRVRGRVSVPTLASAKAEDTAKLIRLRVAARTLDGGAQCLAAVEDSPAFAEPQITNVSSNPALDTGGDVEIQSTLRAFSGICRNGNSVSLEQETFANGRSAGFTTVDSAVPDANGNVDFRFRDDGSNYGTWRLSVDGQSSVVGQCLPTSTSFRLPRPTYVRKLPANGGIESDIFSRVTPFGDKAIVEYKVTTYPATDAAQARCVNGQQLKVRTSSLGDNIFGVYTLTLDSEGRALLTIPISPHATRISAALSSNELGSGPGFCVPQADLHDDILNGSQKIASPAPMTIKEINFASQLRVGSAVSATVMSEESNCLRTEVLLNNSDGDTIARAFTDKSGRFSIAVPQVFAPGSSSWLTIKPFKAAYDTVSCAGITGKGQGLQWGTPRAAPPLPPKKTTSEVSFTVKPEPKGKNGLRPPATTAIVTVRIGGGPADLPCAYNAIMNYRQAWNAPTPSNPKAIASEIHDNIASSGHAPSLEKASFEVPLVDLGSLLYVKVTFPKGYEACLSPDIAKLTLPAYDDGQLDPGNWEYPTYREAVKNLPAFAEAHKKCSEGTFAYGVKIVDLAPRKGYADKCATLTDYGLNIAETLAMQGFDASPAGLAADFALNLAVPGADDLKWEALHAVDGTNPNPDALKDLKSNALNELKNDTTGGQFKN